jgi:hypothetical protein
VPKATANTLTSEKHDLKTLPEGWVSLRSMTYGQMLQRLDMAGEMSFAKTKGNQAEGKMQMMQAKVTCFEFSSSIVDHNLEDEDGRKLDFSRLEDVRQLDPRIGAEISSLIDELNKFGEEELGN